MSEQIETCEVDPTADGYAIEWDAANIFQAAGVRCQDAEVIGDGEVIERVTSIYPMRCSCSVSVGNEPKTHSKEVYFSDIKIVHKDTGDVVRHIVKGRVWGVQ